MVLVLERRGVDVDVSSSNDDEDFDSKELEIEELAELRLVDRGAVVGGTPPAPAAVDEKPAMILEAFGKCTLIHTFAPEACPPHIKGALSEENGGRRVVIFIVNSRSWNSKHSHRVAISIGRPSDSSGLALVHTV